MTSLAWHPYRAVVAGVPHSIDRITGNRYEWAEPTPPRCECGASLGMYADPTDRRVPVAGDITLPPRAHCYACGRDYRIEGLQL
jgi:hypothetical protein